VNIGFHIIVYRYIHALQILQGRGSVSYKRDMAFIKKEFNYYAFSQIPEASKYSKISF